MEPIKGSLSPPADDSAKHAAVTAASHTVPSGIRLIDTVPHQSLYIGGVQVNFPFQPYPSQLGMMNHMIWALHRKQNAMIESPTGSGKSLALLCASLAWSQDFAAKRRRLRANVEMAIKRFCKHNYADIACLHDLGVLVDDTASGSDKDDDEAPPKGTVDTLPDVEGSVISDGSASADPATRVPSPVPSTPASSDPTSRKGTKRTGAVLEQSTTLAVTMWQKTAAYILGVAKSRMPAGLTSADIDGLREALENQNDEIPKIYFGARTHRQVSQLVDELRRKTPYRLRMAVLGSRSQTCINKEVLASGAMDENCRAAVDNGTCGFRVRAQVVASSRHVQPGGEQEIWDLEDMVKLGRDLFGCPYYAARELAEKAQLVFCPYNYIVDPSIRSAVGIDITNSIVILDEAHNIENAAREAGSCEITDRQLEWLADECTDMITDNILVAHHTVIKTMAQTLINWLRASDMVYEFSDHEKQTAVWPNDSASLGEVLNELSLTPEFIVALECAHTAIENYIKSLRADKNRFVEASPSEEEEPDPHLSLGAMRNVQLLLWVLKRATPSSAYTGDYRLAAIRSTVRDLPDSRPTTGRQQQRLGGLSSGPGAVVNTLALWSMSPGVVFAEIAQQARSVVLTSGTLSPLGSYASELRAEFASTLEANHVIDPQRFLAMVIECGPSRQPVVAKHKTVGLMSFQDDVGAAVVAIAAQCPDGMLVFAPSYALLSGLFARWEATGVMEALQQSKMVFQEPAGGSSKAFSKMLARFKKTLDSERGAILFAVYRGKVSEGIDFADKLCRTVVNIGIPYPPLKDVKVILKREYNDLRAQPAADGSAQAERLVSGTEWYDTQAFRAFNQALGRCLRHKDDWGAIIILEARFANPRNAARLSKWIRSHICEYADFDDAIRDLCSFYAARIASDKAATASTKAATASTKRLATPPPAMPAAKLIRPEAVVFISDDDDFM